MEAIHEKKMTSNSTRLNEYNDIVADRIANVSDVIAGKIRTGSVHVDKHSLGQADALFMLDALSNYVKDQTINEITPEKKKQLRRIKSKIMFNETLVKHGGVWSSTKVADLLGVSKVTIKNKKDAGKLLALNLDGEFYFPVFQFTEDEKISEKGVLKGVAELLSLIVNLSDRMQYSFFMEDRSVVIDGVEPKGRTFTVAELLKTGPSLKVMQELFRLARLYGSQDPA